MNKNIRLITMSILSFLLMLSMGCQYTPPAHTPTESAVETTVEGPVETNILDVSTDKKKTELSASPTDVIYISGTLSAGTYTGLNKSDYDFQSSGNLHIYFNSEKEKNLKENVHGLSIKINGNLINGYYERTEVYTAIKENNSRMNHLREANLYTGTFNGQKVEFLCRSGTNELLRLYGKQSSGNEPVENNFTCEVATEKANELIASLYGQETANKYTHTQTSFVDNFSKYCVLYVRYCHGYMTEEQIAVYYTPQGELSDIVALKKGYVDIYEDLLTTNMISQAEETLRSAVNEGSIGGFRIMLSSDGNCYLEAQALIEKERPAWFPTEDDSNVYQERILLYVPIE